VLGSIEAEDSTGGHDKESSSLVFLIDDQPVHLADAMQVPVNDRHSSEVIDWVCEPEVAVHEVHEADARRCGHGGSLPGSHVERASTWTATIKTTRPREEAPAMKDHDGGSEDHGRGTERLGGLDQGMDLLFTVRVSTSCCWTVPSGCDHWVVEFFAVG
jgi:hypothetical protein